jgi:hypothetical protein
LCCCRRVKATETVSNTENSLFVKSQSHAPNFTKVLDGRKFPIRRLWVRNGRFYAQLKVEDPATGTKKTRRVPLLADGEPVKTAAQAVAEMNRLKTQRTDNDISVLGYTHASSQ